MSALVAEFEGLDLGDVRLNRRARKVLARLGDKPTVSIPAACGGWDETRDAYRLFDHDNVTAQQALDQAPELGQIEFDLPKTENRKAQRIIQTLRAVRVTLKAPYRVGIKLPDVEVTALLAQEQNPPDGTDPIGWLLLTNLSIDTAEQAGEKIAWYLCPAWARLCPRYRDDQGAGVAEMWVTMWLEPG